MVVLCKEADEGRHEVLPWGIGVGMIEYHIVPTEVHEGKNSRVTEVSNDSSLGSATAAGGELWVSQRAMAAGYPACFIPARSLSFLSVDHAHVISCVCLGICYSITFSCFRYLPYTPASLFCHEERGIRRIYFPVPRVLASKLAIL